jgi:hypothetical protein
MTDIVQINTLDEELEWEEWKGVCRFYFYHKQLVGCAILETCCRWELSGYYGTRGDVSTRYCEGKSILIGRLNS